MGSSSWAGSWCGGQPLAPFAQQESFKCYPVLRPVLVALRCGHRSWGTGPQVILLPEFLGFSSIAWMHVFISEIQHGMVGGSFGSGAECLASDLGFATSAVGKSGNLSEPQFPHLQSGNGANISYEGLRGGANATTKRMLLAQEGARQGVGRPLTAQAERPRKPGVVTVTRRESQLRAA